MNRKFNKRAVVLLVCLAICLTATVGGTLAFLFAHSDRINNIFTPSKVNCQVSKDTNGNVLVTNTGDTDAYIRVAIVATWVRTVDGKEVVSAEKPAITFEYGTGWFEADDGYYYYKLPLSKDGITDVFSVDLTPAGSQTGYSLNVEVVASAIQATSDAVADWSNAVTIGDDGKLTGKN